MPWHAKVCRYDTSWGKSVKMAPPYFQGVFQPVFTLEIHFIFAIRITEAMILSCFFWYLKMARVKRVIGVSGECAGNAILLGYGVSFWHPLMRVGRVPLPGSRVSFACRNFPKSKFVLFSSPPTISAKNGAINIIITKCCCDSLGSAKACRNVTP